MPIESLLMDFTRRSGVLSDITDPRFVAPAAKNPVEYETAWTLYSLVRSMKAHTVVETGTNIGLSSLAIAQALEDDDLPGSHLYTYDIVDFEVQKSAKRFGLAHRLSFFKQSSLESNLIGRLAKIDLLFLDSLTELLEAEFNLFWPLLRRTSKVMIHDSRLYSGKQNAIKKIVARYGWSELSFSAGRGITILAPGDKGLIAEARPIRYSVILDARKTPPVLQHENWPLPDPEQIWQVGTSEITNTLFPHSQVQKERSIREVFRKALESQSDYVLFVNIAVENLEHELLSLWKLSQQILEKWDYIAPSHLPFVDPFSGGLELQQVSQRWITDRTVIRTPQVSHLIFLVNARLLREVGGFIDILGDEHWSFTSMVARLSLATGFCYPSVDIPSGKRWLSLSNGTSRRESNALRSAINFYRAMPYSIRTTYLKRWQRLVRIYAYGLSEENRLWPHLLSKPLKPSDLWQIIYSCYFGR